MSSCIIPRQPSSPISDTSDWPVDMHTVLTRIFTSRDIKSADELETSLDRLLPYDRLTHINQAVDLLATALEQQQQILIVGDFDADGATSCAVAVRALRALGAGNVSFLVPNRFEFGYGLTPEIVAVAIERFHPDLIITVDNGIASYEGVAAARAAGITVLITDHHLPGSRLPDAHAIVNPNQVGDSFPSKNLAGVGVIFYVMLALRARLRQLDWFKSNKINVPKLACLLDIVALGTVADVVPLDQNNRILVAQGLARIQSGQACAGIRALIEVSRRQAHRLVAADLGFALGPKLNAAGRLDDMSLGIQCLLTDDDSQAAQMVQQLDQLNRERREIESLMQQQALDSLDKLTLDETDDLPFGLCIYDPDWHQGVIGILASRIKERLHRPVIAFALAQTGEIKGSARSVPGLHIRDVLDAVAVGNPGLIRKFGGHAMAAGLTLAETDLDQFRLAFDGEVRRHLGVDDLQGVIYSDGQLGPLDLSLDLAEDLRGAGPWGQGFPEPVFDGAFSVADYRIVGEHHLKMTLVPVGEVSDGSTLIDAIAFNTLPEDLPDQVIECAYRLDVNEFRGQKTVQMIIEYIQGQR